MKLLSRVRLLATPWTAAYQAPPSMGFSGQQYWSGVPLHKPRLHKITERDTQKSCHITVLLKICFIHNSGSQTIVPSQQLQHLPRNLSEMQEIGLTPGLSNQKLWGGSPHVCILTSPPGEGRLPSWPNGKESPSQCRRNRFDPSVGKIPWRRKWQPTPVFLPGESHRWSSLVGCSPWGHSELDTTEGT